MMLALEDQGTPGTNYWNCVRLLRPGITKVRATHCALQGDEK